MKHSLLEIYRFKVETRFIDSSLLPSFKGATLRGAFGIALRETVCVDRKNQNCSTCLIHQGCAYKQIFSVEIEKDSQYMNIPSPIILEPPYENQRFYDKGSKFNFGCIVIGRMVEYFPYLVLGIKKMGEKGIGIKGHRGAFKLLKIRSKNKIVYDGEKEVLREFRYPEKIKCPTSSIENLTLRFISPTRIKADGNLINGLPFPLLIKTLLRRISLLKKNYCQDSQLNLDYNTLIEKACKVEVISCNLRWYDWERFSTRQKTAMKLGGFIGEISYAGNFNDFMEYLKIGELIHIGKNTSFGLGKYVIV
ncbi:MAG: CRISPR system precrRNA processing endoribonuclease RAMP protein Cas6 [Candidatus Omnitrophica bacterium]|nr:CRISPR system precrRNA processing endoribonuclease RAMP protein Cas6 [Candidatus Omnitrophota bacterium]